MKHLLNRFEDILEQLEARASELEEVAKEIEDAIEDGIEDDDEREAVENEYYYVRQELEDIAADLRRMRHKLENLKEVVGE